MSLGLKRAGVAANHCVRWAQHPSPEGSLQGQSRELADLSADSSSKDQPA